MTKTPNSPKAWSPDEDARLLEAVKECGEGNWIAISNRMLMLKMN